MIIFTLIEDIIEELKLINQLFNFSEDVIAMLSKKKKNNYQKADYDRDSFYAPTDGQLGDYEDYGGDIDDVMLWLGSI